MALHVSFLRLSETRRKFAAADGLTMEFDLNKGSSTGSLQNATLVKQTNDGALYLRLNPPLSQQFRLRLTVDSISTEKIFFLTFNTGIQSKINFPFSDKTFHVPGPTVVARKDDLYCYDGKMTHFIKGEIRENNQLSITVLQGAISFLFPLKVSTLKLHFPKHSEVMAVMSVNFSPGVNPCQVVLPEFSSKSKL